MGQELGCRGSTGPCGGQCFRDRLVLYRDTSLKRPPPPGDRPRGLGIGLLQGPRRRHSLMSEATLYWSQSDKKNSTSRCVSGFPFRLHLSDTKVYEPSLRALLGTAAHLCRVVVLRMPCDSSTTC